MQYNKVVLDFDGIFASQMIYTQEGKWAKIFTWGIRHAVDMLVEGGFEVHIITGDSTEFGQNISKKFTENIKIKSITCCNSKDKLKILKKKFDLNTVIYSGDDIYDIEIFRNTFGITHANTHESISCLARYVSKYTPNDYYFTDMALYILAISTATFSKDDVAGYIAKESTMEPMTDYLMDQRIKKIFILQQYSMRNHSDNTYNPLLDGNLNLTLHRLLNPLSDDHRKKATITIPDNCNKDQLAKLNKFIKDSFPEGSIEFMHIPYGLNALENRAHFADFKAIELNHYDVIISDFSNVKMFKYERKKVIYNFNISKADGLERAYIDPYFTEQYDTILNNINGFAYVLNKNQKDHFVSRATSEERKIHFKSSIIVDSKIINKELLNDQKYFFSTSSEVYNTISKDLKFLADNIYDLVLFFPFRISDECYNFEGLFSYLNSQNKKVAILITDPNDSYGYSNKSESVTVINLRHVNTMEDLDPKTLYFTVLKHIVNNRDIYIPIFEDPRKVLHQSILEMNHFVPDNTIFLDKDCFDYKTLTKFNNKKEIKDYLNTLYYE